MLYISTETTPLSSPKYLPSNEPNIITVATVLAVLVYFSMLIIRKLAQITNTADQLQTAV